MIRITRHPLGLLGQILAILLLTVVIEFGTSTLLYERASRLSLREDEAHRLAEHLVISRKLIAERAWHQRREMAHELTTDRYEVHWQPSRVPPTPLAAELDSMRRQIIAWEPSLATTDLRLSLPSPGRRSVVVGGLRLPDGSWLQFSTRESVSTWDLALSRILLALVPAIALFILGGLLIRRILNPLRRLAHATERVGIGDEVLLTEAGTIEVRHLIRAFNEMHRRINRLIAERTEALAAVGHDIRTPLARLQLRIDSIADGATREAMDGDVAEMEAMVASLLAFLGGEKNPEDAVRIDLASFLATIVDEQADTGRDVEYFGPNSLDAVLRPVGLRRAIGNLVENGLRYGNSVDVTLKVTAGQIRIMIEDDGPGIPEDRIEDVIKPFTRLDYARMRDTQGLGLGLAIVTRALDHDGGTLTLSNRAEGGLRAEILFPID